MSKHGVLIVVFSTCLIASSAFAADEPPTHTDVAEMNASLKEIARVLKQQAETQKADLLLKRLSFATTQLASAQERLNRIDREIAQAESDRGEFETLLASAQRESPSASAATPENRITGIRARLQTIRDRLSALSQDRISAENDLGALRREARDWQTLLDKTLTSGS